MLTLAPFPAVYVDPKEVREAKGPARKDGMLVVEPQIVCWPNHVACESRSPISDIIYRKFYSAMTKLTKDQPDYEAVVRERGANELPEAIVMERMRVRTNRLFRLDALKLNEPSQTVWSSMLIEGTWTRKEVCMVYKRAAQRYLLMPSTMQMRVYTCPSNGEPGTWIPSTVGAIFSGLTSLMVPSITAADDIDWKILMNTAFFVVNMVTEISLRSRFVSVPKEQPIRLYALPAVEDRQGTTAQDAFRLYPSVTQVESVYFDTGRFKITPDEFRGSSNTLSFPYDAGSHTPDSTFVTCAGGFVPCNIYVPTKHPTALRQMLTRFTGTKDLPTYRRCMDNQFRMLYGEPGVDDMGSPDPATGSVGRQAKILLSRLFSDVNVTMEEVKEWVREHAADPHVKREERIQARDFLNEENGAADRLWKSRPGKPFSPEVSLKQETLAKGKRPRGVVNYGVPASLMGARVAARLKEALAKEWIVLDNGHRLKFVKDAKQRDVTDAMRELVRPQADYVSIFHSDDSSLTIRTPGGFKTFDIDVESCDSMHSALFFLLPTVLPGASTEVINRLIDMCRQPFTVGDPLRKFGRSLGKTYKVKLVPEAVSTPRGLMKLPFMGSGSPLTTILASLASLVIHMIVSEKGCKTADEIRSAARSVGYTVTVVERKTIAQIQFLKHSLVHGLDGEYYAVQNIGVLLRALGKVRGDLPGKGCRKARTRDLLAAAFQCWAPYLRAPWIDTMRKHFSGKPTQKAVDAVRDMSNAMAQVNNENAYPVQTEDPQLAVRYGLSTLDDLYELSEATYETQHNSHAAALILKEDYEL